MLQQKDLVLRKIQEQRLGLMGSTSHDISSMMIFDDINHSRQFKGEIAIYPLYEQLLSTYVTCFHISIPIYQLPLTYNQLLKLGSLLRSYVSSQQQHQQLSPHERQELDNFLVGFTSSNLFLYQFFLID